MRKYGGTAREAASLREAPPSRSLPKRLCRGNSGEEAASLREAPPPQTPSPEEQLAFGVVASAELVPPVCWARFLAACASPRRLTEPPRTCGVEDEPLRPLRGHLPFQGRLCRKCAKRLPPQRELPAVRLTEDKLFCWGMRCHGRRIYLPSFAPRIVPLFLRKETRRISRLRTRGGGRSPSGSFPIAPATPSGRSLYNLCVLHRWQVAAALSAAVTTT